MNRNAVVTHGDFFEFVDSFDELMSAQFSERVNAFCWRRDLRGDFDVFARAVETKGEIVSLEDEELLGLPLSLEGSNARSILLRDLKLLREAGLSPSLELVPAYDKSGLTDCVPLDVYDFHADSATVPIDTFLCSYTVAASQGVSNRFVERYTDDPKIRAKLLEQFGGQDDEAFSTYLREHFYDLHYRARPSAKPIDFGLGNLWRIATQYPGSPVAPCIHRAPTPLVGQPPRLLLIS